MKRFIVSILCVAVFFIGLGSLVDKVGAKFKSDERALAIIAQARQAIGGDAAIKNVRSMTIVGSAAQTFTIDGATRTEQGNLEIAFQLPGQFSKMLKIGKEVGDANGGAARHETRVFITTKDDDKTTTNVNGAEGSGKVFIVKKGDEEKVVSGENEIGAGDNKKIVRHAVAIDGSHMRQNELFRTTFALLLSAPEGLDANYDYAGEASVDGNNCDVILAQSGGSSFKLFIDQSSHLPLMMSYQGTIPMVFKFNKDELKTGDSGQAKNFLINKDGSQTPLNDGKVQIIARSLDTPEATAEYQVKFSDYRNVGGVQLPYKWTQTVGGQPDQNVDVVSYEINPPNIADKFNNQKVMVRMKKAQ
ncbi:MAG: hypothetical protein M3033_05140 [Acidobacteriota bacterium]|nr:hypothetical protein [Acidobacteriota bacterium]